MDPIAEYDDQIFLQRSNALVQVAETSNLKLEDSKFAPKIRHTPLTPGAPNVEQSDMAITRTGMTPTQQRLLKKMANDGGKDYQENVVAKFRSTIQYQQAPVSSPEQNHHSTRGKSHKTSTGNNLTIAAGLKQVTFLDESSRSSDTVPFPVFEDDDPGTLSSPPFEAKVTQNTASQAAAVESPGQLQASILSSSVVPTPVSENLCESTLADNADVANAVGSQALGTENEDLAYTVAGLSLAPEAQSTSPQKIDNVAHDLSTDTEAEPSAGIEEDREHLKHFKSWGAPEGRNKPSKLQIEPIEHHY